MEEHPKGFDIALEVADKLGFPTFDISDKEFDKILMEQEKRKAKRLLENQKRQVSHSELAIDDALDDYLMHYGVPGMKWGVRKQRKGSGSGRSTSKSSSTKKSAPDGVSDKIRQRLSANGRAKSRIAKARRKAKVAEEEAKAAERIAKAKARTQASTDAPTQSQNGSSNSSSNQNDNSNNGGKNDKNAYPDHRTDTSTTRRTGTSQYTDKELNDTIRRMKLESEYSNLVAQSKPKSTSQKMREFGKKAVADAAGNAVKAGLNQVMGRLVNKAVGKAFADAAKDAGKAAEDAMAGGNKKSSTNLFDVLSDAVKADAAAGRNSSNQQKTKTKTQRGAWSPNSASRVEDLINKARRQKFRNAKAKEQRNRSPFSNVRVYHDYADLPMGQISPPPSTTMLALEPPKKK